MKETTQAPAQQQTEEKSEGTATFQAPPSFGLTAGAASGANPVQMQAVAQRQEGDNYERGNRPNPSSSNGSTYEIRSNRGSIVTVGQRVDYRLHQIQTTMRSTDSVLRVRWQVLNGATGNGADAVEAGPDNSWEMNGARASVPGVHTIQAIVTLNGNPLETVSFTQVVENGDTDYANLANVRPTPINSMADFIALVQRIEAAYPGYAWQDVASKIRKQYYPGPNDSESGGITAAFTWDDLIDEQQHVAPLQSPPCAAADIAALQNNATINGIDIGHVLTGLDSMNFPETAGIFSMSGTSGPAAATWSGDVGSALVFWANQAGLSDPSGSRREEFYNRYASMDDLLGDLDGINVAAMPSLGPNASLSARLQAYYQTNSTESVNRRYHRFCEITGLTVVNGSLDGSARAYISDQIIRFARAYNTKEGALGDALLTMPMAGGMMGGGYIPPVNNHELTSSHRMAENLDWFTDRFIRDIETGLASE